MTYRYQPAKPVSVRLRCEHCGGSVVTASTEDGTVLACLMCNRPHRPAPPTPLPYAPEAKTTTAGVDYQDERKAG